MGKMENSFKLYIYTPEKIVLEGQAVSITVPGASGYLGILAHHAPLVCSTLPGTINLRDQTGKTMAIHSKGKGFLEVLNNNVTLLLESV